MPLLSDYKRRSVKSTFPRSRVLLFRLRCDRAFAESRVQPTLPKKAGHLMLTLEFSGTTKSSPFEPEIFTMASGGDREFRASWPVPAPGIFLPGDLENLFRVQKRTYWL